MVFLEYNAVDGKEVQSMFSNECKILQFVLKKFDIVIFESCKNLIGIRLFLSSVTGASVDFLQNELVRRVVTMLYRLDCRLLN